MKINKKNNSCALRYTWYIKYDVLYKLRLQLFNTVSPIVGMGKKCILVKHVKAVVNEHEQEDLKVPRAQSVEAELFQVGTTLSDASEEFECCSMTEAIFQLCPGFDVIQANLDKVLVRVVSAENI